MVRRRARMDGQDGDARVVEHCAGALERLEQLETTLAGPLYEYVRRALKL
jgi:hypothetical protein